MEAKELSCRLLPSGNYLARRGRYYAFITKRPHGGWCVFLSVYRQIIASEGYFSSSLMTIEAVKEWIKEKAK